MITIKEFQKLEAFQNAGHTVKCDGEAVSLFYNKEDDEGDWPDEYNCTFTFDNDRYGTVCTLGECPYNKAEWTVEKVENINWRNARVPKPKVSERKKVYQKK